MHEQEIVFLRQPAVLALTGMSETSLKRAKDFPSPVRIGPRQIVWIKHEVQQWMMSRIAQSRASGAAA